jgi:hypothetical protein
VPVDWYEDAETAWGARVDGEFQVREARDVLARWDAGQDGEPAISREKALADHLRALLAIVAGD